MPITRVIRENLRRAQAFDQNLKSAAGIERIILRRADEIISETNPTRRLALLRDIANEVKANVSDTVFPQAQRLGQQNARDVIDKISNPEVPEQMSRRQLADAELRRRLRERSEILNDQLDSAVVRLNARVSRFYREPAEGSNAAKPVRLRELFQAEEKRRKDYETRLADFYAGRNKTRPSRPRLEFVSDLVESTKAEARSQSRRLGTDAETLEFRKAGYSQFIWITPNGHSACPDCQKRQRVVLPLGLWEQYGRPGSGMTACQDNCFCMLLPVEVTKTSPSLANADATNTRVTAVMTTERQADVFNRNRFRP